jgi:hypothetical protein
MQLIVLFVLLVNTKLMSRYVKSVPVIHIAWEAPLLLPAVHVLQMLVHGQALPITKLACVFKMDMKYR